MKQHGYEFERGEEFERRLHIWADNDGAFCVLVLDEAHS